MPSKGSGNRFYLNEFDESIDDIMLDIINAAMNGEDMEFWINSEGGDAKRAFGLVQLIRLAQTRDATVSTFVLSEAFSAGSIVAVAGSPGCRYVADDGFYMLHFGEFEQNATSPVASRRIADANIAQFANLLEHYRTYTELPNLDEELRSDYFYVDAEAAVEFGLADGIIN